jgi:hypothetical protein
MAAAMAWRCNYMPFSISKLCLNGILYSILIFILGETVDTLRKQGKRARRGPTAGAKATSPDLEG